MAARVTHTSTGRAGPASAPYERRRFDRIDAHVRARLQTPDMLHVSTIDAQVVDLSDRGICLRTQRMLAVGTRVHVDLECQVPIRVHMGFDPDALIIDGPMHTHLVRVTGTIVRASSDGPRSGGWRIGVQVCPQQTNVEELETMRSYVEFLREQLTWTL